MNKRTITDIFLSVLIVSIGVAENEVTAIVLGLVYFVLYPMWHNKVVSNQ